LEWHLVIDHLYDTVSRHLIILFNSLLYILLVHWESKVHGEPRAGCLTQDSRSQTPQT